MQFAVGTIFAQKDLATQKEKRCFAPQQTKRIYFCESLFFFGVHVLELTSRPSSIFRCAPSRAACASANVSNSTMLRKTSLKLQRTHTHTHTYTHTCTHTHPQPFERPDNVSTRTFECVTCAQNATVALRRVCGECARAHESAPTPKQTARAHSVFSHPTKRLEEVFHRLPRSSVGNVADVETLRARR